MDSIQEQLLPERLKSYLPDCTVKSVSDGITVSRGFSKINLEKNQTSYSVSSQNRIALVYLLGALVMILCIGIMIGKRKMDWYYLLPPVVSIVSLLLLYMKEKNETNSIKSRVQRLL